MVNEKISPVLITVAVVAVVVSVFSLGLIYLSANTLFSQISGRATTGEANLTVETKAEINFTTRAISWGNGRVDQSSTAASLTTSNWSGIANVTNGNWTLDSEPTVAGYQAGGMLIQNIGNSNVTINFSVAKNAATFIGGSNPAYEWNLSHVEAGSCLNSSQQNISFRQGNLVTATSATSSNLWCDVFPFESGKDSLRLDFNLTIPENSFTGFLSDIVTATVTSL